jgi:endoglucanase
MTIVTLSASTLLIVLGQSGNSGPCETQGGGIVRGPKDRREIALAFTAHEYVEGGVAILDALARRHAKASFFLTGAALSQSEKGLAKSSSAALVRRIVAEGHYIGPHSDQHLLYSPWDGSGRTLINRETFRRDLEANLKKIEGFGVRREDVRYFVPPYEHYSPQIVRWAAEMGLTLVNPTPGTFAAADYTAESDRNFVSAQRIFDSILARERSDANGLNGFLLLMHLGAGDKRKDKFHARLGELLDHLSQKGYRFVRIDEMLRSDPAHSADPAHRADPAHKGEVFLRASQVGYRTDDPKTAVVFSAGDFADTFRVLEADSGKLVFEGKAKVLAGAAWGKFTRHAEIDFTALRQVDRRLYITIGRRLAAGASRSIDFRIGDDVFQPLPDVLLEFMRHQRCGYNPWLDAECHPHDGRTAYGPEPGGTTIDARGGWHDAGDLLKYLLTSSNATAQLLLAWQLHKEAAATGASGRAEVVRSSGSSRPDLFADRVDARGKPGANGAPDLLDEAQWGIEWMLKLHPAPDQLYHQVADDRDHAGWRLPQHDAADYGWGKGGARVVYFADGRPQGLKSYQSQSSGVANLAGRYAAAMALAYQTWKDDPKRRPLAQRCLRAGVEVYRLGRAKEGVQQGNSYSAPYRYEETTWADDMEWGAAELYRATGDRGYLEDAKRYARLAADESWMGRTETKHYQFYPFVNLGHFRLHGLVDAATKATLAGYYRAGIERCVRMGQQNPYGIGVPFIWCSNNLVVALVTQCECYERMTGDARFRGFAARQRDWLLGCNPWGCTMFTGIGERFPQDVHLMTTRLSKRPVRGGLVDGPVYARIFQGLRGISIRQPDVLAAFQDPRAVYHDDVGDYSTNEPTMDGTASAILMFSMMAK